jgi:hypothetical protein
MTEEEWNDLRNSIFPSKIVYQYNSDLQIIAEYANVFEAERITGIPEKTLRSSIFKRSLCRKTWYFSREKNFVPWVENRRGEKAGKKFVVTLPDKMWDELLVLIGQRKKQDIFRDLLREWIDKEKFKKNYQGGL